jgi:hypothetical protein
MRFDPQAYGPEVAAILRTGGDGERPIPLVADHCTSTKAGELIRKHQPKTLFPSARLPNEAFAGLWLYFSGFEEAHEIVQALDTTEAGLWHAILHRQEPDSGNSAYWFRRAGSHPVFPQLVKESLEIISRNPEAEFRPSAKWDPFGFILFCERAREQPGSSSEGAALEIQLAEWQLLFDYCARAKD